MPNFYKTFIASLFVALVGCSSSVPQRAPQAFPEPVQRPFLTPQMSLFLEKGYWLAPVANYQVDAVVLSTKRYRWSDLADFAPVDFTLAWGKLAQPHVLNKLKVSQDNRSFQYEFDDQALYKQLGQRTVVASMGNHLMVPASEVVKEQLLAVQEGHAVRAKGYLVNILHQDGNKVRKTSKTRTDVGDASSEIFYVLELETLAPSY